MNAPKRFNIEEIPLVRLYIATDSLRRIRLSADLCEMFDLKRGQRVALGYDRANKAIALRVAASPNDPTAANVDKRGYLSARAFFAKTQVEPVARRYSYVAEQDGWLVFIADDNAT